MDPDRTESKEEGIRARHRFGLVLLLLLATFLVLMTGTTAKWARPITVGLSGATLLAALSAARVRRHLRRVASAVVLIAVVGSISLVGIGRSGEGATGIISGCLVVLAPFVIARSMLRRSVVDSQTIMAALCVYVLFGMLWAFVYSALGNIRHSAFFVQQRTATSADYLYFSFITQLTVGYGDLTAAGNLERALAVLEALTGQLYLVTIVSVLVSRLVPRRGTETTPSPPVNL